MQTRAYAAVLPALALVLAACGTGAAPPPAGAAPSGPLDAASSDEPWRTDELRDVRSGETFRIADLSGSLVVIEPMAIWCTSCARQQREASKALAELEGADIVYISLDVDPSEREDDLATYADKSGFDWRFVVASRRVARSLAEAFGDQVLSPPSTPSIVITPGGEVIGPSFGIRNAKELQAELLELLS